LPLPPGTTDPGDEQSNHAESGCLHRPIIVRAVGAERSGTSALWALV
jgi:hypothetical protein